jgi:hypothetical protein
VTGITIDKAREISVFKAAIFLFSQLTPQAQRALLSGKFLSVKIARGAYTKTIKNKVLPSVPTKVSDFFDDPVMDFFAYFVKSAFDEWAFAEYGRQPWVYAGVQFLGDHLYIATLAYLTAKKYGHPQAGWVHASILEVQIVAERLAAVGVSYYGLLQDRQTAVGSFSGLISRGASIALAEQTGLLSAQLRASGYSVERTLESLAAAVSGTDIPEFRSVADKLLRAQAMRLQAGGSPTAEVKRLTSEAVALADKLDHERRLSQKVFVTAFGSYSNTTRAVVQILGLPGV